jgi:hypothetical protein
VSETPADQPAEERQPADVSMPTATEEDAIAVEGRTYAFKVRDDEVNLTFPQGMQELGGSQQTARLEGRLELFIEDTPSKGGEARIWIADIEENVHGLNVFGIDVFTLETSMLDHARFDVDNPMGSLNVETGEYTLTYVIKPRHAILSEHGFGDDLGTIVVREKGTIKLNPDGGASLRTDGSLTIEEGPFTGTGITYSPKGGNAPRPTEVTLYIYLPPTGCGTYAGNYSDTRRRRITGSGVFATVRYGDAGTRISFRGITRDYISNQWDTSWNGMEVSGFWSTLLINRGIPCSSFPSSVSLNVKVPA